MNNYKNIKLKRIYGNLASVRDYVWQRCVKENMGIIFECNDAKMTVEPWEIKNAKPGSEVFESKFDKKKYRLVDFNWKSDSSNRLI